MNTILLKSIIKNQKIKNQNSITNQKSKNQSNINQISKINFKSTFFLSGTLSTLLNKTYQIIYECLLLSLKIKSQIPIIIVLN